MVDYIVLTLTLVIFLGVFSVVFRAILTKQKIIGRPPVPVPFFILAKTLVAVSLAFLLMRGLNIDVGRIFPPALWIDIIALALLITGTVILILSTIQLNKDLIFGLSDTETHKLQTRGIYSLSRHPFYLGFIFILFSSCLLCPNYLNIAAFLITWFIHHRIMISEEQFLITQYGEEYRQYQKKVKRYISF